MSFVDMAYLRQEDIHGGMIYYRRRKTGQTYTVKIIPEVQEILDRYRDRCFPWALPVMLDFDGEGRLRPLVYEGATAEDRKRFEARLYLRYKYNLSHYLRFYRDMSKKLELPVKLSFNVARHSWASLARKHGVSVSVISAGTGAHFRKDHANLPRRTGQQHRGRCERDGGGTVESSGSGSGKKGGEKVEISEKIVFLLSDRSFCVSRGCGKNTVFRKDCGGFFFLRL